MSRSAPAPVDVVTVAGVALPPALVRVLAWAEARLLDRRPVAASLLFTTLMLPLVGLFWALQAWALTHADVLGLYRNDALWLAQLANSALLLWLLGTVAYGLWRGPQAGSTGPRHGALTVLTFTPVLLGVTLLAIGYGLKDTPMGIAILVVLVLGRGLFDFATLLPGLVGATALILGSEVLIATDAMPYAPLLARPVFDGGPLAPWWALWTRMVYNASGIPFAGLLFFFMAVWGRRRRALERMVRSDMLTGLANRRAFMERLEAEGHRHRRSGQPLAVLMCDVDHFKRVNDTHGHPAGDAVLIQVGRILREATRGHVDMAARIGGEEFAVLLPETDIEQAVQIAGRIAARMRTQVFEAEGVCFRATLSIGVALAEDGDFEAALRLADDNLYAAKRAGRDQVVASQARAVA